MSNVAPRRIEVANTKDRMKIRPKKWSHQQDLEALKGKLITIRIINGAQQVGRLLEADQYTIKMQGDFHSSGSQSILTYFKSSLEYFGAV